MNKYNRQYKTFKYYINNEGALVLDVSLITPDKEIKGDLIYGLLEQVFTHLNEEAYKEIMKTIWD